jgi:hypothetical protein
MAVATIERPSRASLRTPVGWGLVFGALQAASPLAFWWLDAPTVYAIGLALIAAIYIGFAVADGRPAVIAVESSVVGIFVVVAAAAVTGSPWLLVLGLAGHGLKDLWLAGASTAHSWITPTPARSTRWRGVARRSGDRHPGAIIARGAGNVRELG